MYTSTLTLTRTSTSTLASASTLTSASTSAQRTTGLYFGPGSRACLRPGDVSVCAQSRRSPC
eukprot:8184955-Lingulodinium_polyedra.AAC.1